MTRLSNLPPGCADADIELHADPDTDIGILRTVERAMKTPTERPKTQS